MSAYDEALAAFDEAQAKLAATPTADLLVRAYELTHKMHGAKFSYQAGTVRDLRQMRDMITAEILRRTGDDTLRVVR
jgi:arginyl-tRNA synthetase